MSLWNKQKYPGGYNEQLNAEAREKAFDDLCKYSVVMGEVATDWKSKAEQLQADLERVTAERDALSAEGKAWADRFVKRGWELTEAKAALDEMRTMRDAAESSYLKQIQDAREELAEARTALACAESTASVLRERENRVADETEASTCAWVLSMQTERDAAQAELDQLRRAWALHMLQLWESQDGEPAGLQGWLKRFDLPESVAALIRAGAGCPIGLCENRGCNQRAPLVTNAVRDMVCAPGWLCKGDS